MFIRKAAMAVGLVLALLLVGLATWLWQARLPLFSSPSAVRTNSYYFEAHAPGTNIPAAPTNLFSSIRIQRGTNELQFWIPSSNNSSEIEYLPLQSYPKTAFEPVSIGTGSVRLAYIAAAYSAPASNIGWGLQVPARFYDSNLREIQRESASNVIDRYDGKMNFQGEFPQARFYFVCSNIGPFKPMKFRVFDARTHHPLTSGHSSSVRNNVFYYESSIGLWHQTPLELAVTIATGPTNSYSLPPLEGAELSYPGGHIRVLAISDLDFSGSSSSSDGQTNHITLTGSVGEPNSSDKRPRSTFLLYSWPTASLRGELEFIDQAGQKMETYGGNYTGQIIQSRMIGKPEDVKEIRLRHLPNAHRFYFEIPELPGLPEQNRGVDNLFDVHVPHVTFRYEYAFQETIGDLLQMQRSSLALTFSNAYFPTFRTNTTTRALFEEMASLLSNKENQVVVDPERNRIEERQHPIRALIAKLREKLGF